MGMDVTLFYYIYYHKSLTIYYIYYTTRLTTVDIAVRPKVVDAYLFYYMYYTTSITIYYIVCIYSLNSSRSPVSFTPYLMNPPTYPQIPIDCPQIPMDYPQIPIGPHRLDGERWGLTENSGDG